MQQRCALPAELNPRHSTGGMGWHGECLLCLPVALISSQFGANMLRCDEKSWVVPVEHGKHCINPCRSQSHTACLLGLPQAWDVASFG